MQADVAKALAGELVLVVERGAEDGTLYTHEAFIGAFQEALLDRMEFSLTPGMSVRRALTRVAALRSPEAHRATLADALGRLRKHGVPVDPIVLGQGQRIVAVFPFAPAA
jgi:hypothetical protein